MGSAVVAALDTAEIKACVAQYTSGARKNVPPSRGGRTTAVVYSHTARSAAERSSQGFKV